MAIPFFKRGNSIVLGHSNNYEQMNNIPAGMYRLALIETMQGDYFQLNQTNLPEIPNRIYGDTSNICDRVIQSFHERDRNTGVLLSGEKGSGKTLACKILTKRLINAGFPVILISNPFTGQLFEEFLYNLGPCAILVDEFEKIYDDKNQERLLSLLSGVFPSKKLWMLTCNKMSLINDNLINRPDRIYYNIKYGGVSNSFILEYLKDNLRIKERQNDIVTLCHHFDVVNFDMLQTIVEEINRFDCPTKDILKILNTKPSSFSRFWNIKLFKNRIEVKFDKKNYKKYPINIFSPFVISSVEFNQSDMLGFSQKAQAFVFKKGCYKLYMKPAEKKYSSCDVDINYQIGEIKDNKKRIIKNGKLVTNENYSPAFTFDNVRPIN